ncbi:MAG TPA: hypothetical protein PK158_14285, partial [Spirochaetota bacterium]|nr:hypothetical protein [Spirochaetota bacterium]
MEKISRAFRRVFVLIFLSVVITSLSSGNSSDKEFTIKKIANFNNPNSITCVGKYLYVTDTNNHSIRKIDKTTGYVTTFAGMSESHGIADGIGMRAKFNNPSGITSDGHNLYIADSSNHTIRKIFIKTGKVTTIAGSPGNAGSKDGKGKSALFNYPYGITFAENNLYVTDFENSTIRKIEIKTGIVSTIAGNPGTEISKDGIGQSAFFHHPYGIAFNQNNLYITENHTIRKMDLSTGAVTTIAGRPGENGFSEKNGSNALFRYPDGICCDGKNIYISDSYNFIIRKIAIDDDMITTVAGTPGESGDLDGDNQSALFFKPNGIVADGEDI